MHNYFILIALTKLYSTLLVIKLNVNFTISEWASVSFWRGLSNCSLSTVNNKKMCCDFDFPAHVFGTRGHQCLTLQYTQSLGSSIAYLSTRHVGKQSSDKNHMWEITSDSGFYCYMSAKTPPGPFSDLLCYYYCFFYSLKTRVSHQRQTHITSDANQNRSLWGNTGVRKTSEIHDGAASFQFRSEVTFCQTAEPREETGLVSSINIWSSCNYKG